MRVPYFASRDLKLLTIVKPITNMNIGANKSANETPGKTWKPSAPWPISGVSTSNAPSAPKTNEQTIANMQSPRKRSIDKILSLTLVPPSDFFVSVFSTEFLETTALLFSTLKFSFKFVVSFLFFILSP